ncbi:unnamed protein product [Prunus armeniaca]
MQSLGSTEPRVPKIPPRTMLSDYRLTDESEVEEALNGHGQCEYQVGPPIMEVNWCGYPVDKIALIYHYLMVTAQAATKILELNAGLNALLFSTSLEASIEIRHI